MLLPFPILRHGLMLGLTLLSLVVLADGMARIELTRAVAASVGEGSGTVTPLRSGADD